MGIFYNSICIPGNRSEEVRASLERWLRVRGFELNEQPMLFDLDGEVERCAFLVWNERWTVLIFSKYEEEHRLIGELRNWATTLLYVWVQDSDVWGYELFNGDGFAASFNSDPRTYRPFADDERQRPAADPEKVCRWLGLPGHEQELRQAQRHRAVFKEDACLGLCRLLGVEAAAVSYDDLERGKVATLPGWNTAQLLYFHRDSCSPPACGTDLLEVDLSELSTTFGGVYPQTRLTPELLQEVEQMRRRAHLRFLLLKPVSWLAKGWRWGRERMAAPRAESGRFEAGPPLSLTSPEAGDAALGTGPRKLVNGRHECEIVPAPGVVPQRVSGKPALVYSFRVGGVAVTCTARRRWKIDQVLRPPSRSEVVRDESFQTRSGLDVRHLLFALPRRYMAGTTDPSFLDLHVIETHQALYVFLYRFTKSIAVEIEDAIRSTVMSFRLLRPAPETIPPRPA